MIEAEMAPPIPKKLCTSTYWYAWTLSTQEKWFVWVKQACYPQIFAIFPPFYHFASDFHDIHAKRPHQPVELDSIWKNLAKSGLSLAWSEPSQRFSPSLRRAFKQVAQVPESQLPLDISGPSPRYPYVVAQFGLKADLWILTWCKAKRLSCAWAALKWPVAHVTVFPIGIGIIDCTVLFGRSDLSMCDHASRELKHLMKAAH